MNGAPFPHRVLITGAAGAIGTTLRAAFEGRYTCLRLADMRPLGALQPGEEHCPGYLQDAQAAADAVREIDTVIHLAGVPRESTWEKILPNNVAATVNLFEAARVAGVRRIIFASSNHVIGFYPAAETIGPWRPVRPDSRYGVSKVFGEALLRLYADKYGIEGACLRIGSFRERPENVRQLSTWISPRDLSELVRCCIEVPAFRYIVLYGVSANTRRRWVDEAHKLVGFVPQDDAENFAADLPRHEGHEGIADRFHGGENCASEFVGDADHVEPD